MNCMAKEGRLLKSLVGMACPICIEAEKDCPRKGPGRKPEIPDWVMAVLIMVAIAKKKKTKSAQYRYLSEHRQLLMNWLDQSRFPARSTFFDRYRRAHQLFERAISLQGQMAIRYGWAQAECVSVDKSVIRARGPEWHERYVSTEGYKRGADREARWTKTSYHGWIQGYAYEVVVTSEKSGPVWPILASANTANVQENRSFAEKIHEIPRQSRFVLADKGYDSDDFGELIEWDSAGKRTGKHFLCPQIDRKPNVSPRQAWPRTIRRKTRKQHREARNHYFATAKAKRLYSRRSTTVEPFNEWFKSLFELGERVWHHGLDNNKTQILAAVFIYQLLLRINRKYKQNNGQVRWILDTL